jgi:uncharacterized protein (TIGR00725 family)
MRMGDERQGSRNGDAVQIAVIGAGDCSREEFDTAREVGALLGKSGAVLLCGGMSGVMEAASRGAQASGGITVGIIPDTGNGNPYLSVRVRTGLGHARNAVLVQSADSVIAVGGSYGTLSEISIALKTGRKVFSIGSWTIPGVIACDGPTDAVYRALEAAFTSRVS